MDEGEMEAAEVLRQFVDRYGSMQPRSTGARRIQYGDVLYNVDGSTKDPKIDNKTWRGLLVDMGIDDSCYVTNAPPSKKSKSHPDNWLGGHMTSRKDGSVDVGGKCFLMPLCHWHNNTKRNGVAFKLKSQRVLELSGYMLDEPAATFLARAPEGADYRAVFLSADDQTESPPSTKTMRQGIVQSAGKATLMKSLSFSTSSATGQRDYFVIFKRETIGDEMRFVIDEINLP